MPAISRSSSGASQNARVTDLLGTSGVVIGKGADIEKLKKNVAKTRWDVSRSTSSRSRNRCKADRRQHRTSWSAACSRRAMKRDAEHKYVWVLGHQIMSSGRLNGIEIARTEWYRKRGRVPLRTPCARTSTTAPRSQDHPRCDRREGVGSTRAIPWAVARQPPETPRPEEERRPRGPRRDGRGDGDRGDGAWPWWPSSGGTNAAPAGR